MKKFVVIFGVFLALVTNARAEIYRHIDADMVYKIGNFNNKEEVKKLIDDYAESNVPNNPQKTTVSNVIDNYYQHPEYTPIMEAKCQESISWIKGSFGLWEDPNFRANMCLTWETNKKLNKEQIELLASLKNAWENVLGDLIQGDEYRDSFAVCFDNNQEYALQMAVRIYNLVLNQDWPECLFEAQRNISEDVVYYKEPCNEPSEILKNCKNSTNTKLCMQQEIISKVEGFETLVSKWITPEETRKNRKEHLESLFDLTEKFISQIISDNIRQEREVIRLYNFYWSSILLSYQMNLANANLD